MKFRIALLFSFISGFTYGQVKEGRLKNLSIESFNLPFKDTVSFDTLKSLQGFFFEPFSSVEPFREMQVPPSPQMASLGKFGEIPVNHSTGVANVSIPIHSISVNGYTHEINLSYHGSGIKVNQVSSNVGLGWALNPSGVLARTSNKNTNDNYGEILQLPSNFSSFNPNISSSSSFSVSRNNADYMWAHDGLNNCIDTEPDIINFNFGNYSGIMVPIYQGNFREVPYKGFTISQSANSFIIYDKNQTKFTFDVFETNYLPPGCPGSLYISSEGCVNSGVYNKSFYLSKIESKEGGTILFTYEDENYTYAINRLEQKYSWVTGNGCTPDSNLLDQNCIQESTVSGKRLIKIETSENEEILFKYKTEATSDGSREDLPGTKALQYIEIYDKGSQSPVKRVEFKTSYHTSSGSTGPNHKSEWNKRLRLDQVVIDFDQIYSFVYNGNLSPRLSYDQDYYGYHIYNSVYSSIPYHPTHNVNGASREPSSSRVTAGLLNRINYPTGGYSTFQYEQNIVRYGGQNKVGPGVRIKRINSYTDNGALAKYMDYKYLQDGSLNSSGVIDNIQSNINFIDLQSQLQHDIDTGPYRLECDFYLLSSDDQQSSFFGRTYHVTYTRVEEIINDGSQGKTVYHFSQIGDLVSNPSYSIADINYDWTYGIPTKVEVFKGSGTSLEKIEEKTYEYKTFITNNSSFSSYAGPSSNYSFGMKLNRLRSEVFPGQQWQFKPAIYRVYKYGYVSALFSKTKENTKTFRNGGVLESEVLYSIDSLNNQITKELYRNSVSPSEAKARYFYYTNDIGGQSFYSIYNQPILYLDKKIRNGSEYTIGGEYFPITSINGKLLNQKAYTLELEHPVSSYSLNLANPALSVGFRLTNEILEYNSNNYPTLISTNQIKTKILYDYHDTKAVAILNNFEGTSNDVGYTSFESDYKGGWTYTIPFLPLGSLGYTGKTSFPVSGNSISKSGLSTSKSYILSFAVKKNGSSTPNLVVRKNGAVITDSGISNSDIGSNWIVYQYLVSGASSVQIEGNGILIDELRIYPKESTITTFGHIPFVGISFQNPNEMTPVNYSFDSQRRPSIIENGYGERIKQFFYQYKAPLTY
ncbi:hypothetical protein [Algoriphagus marincola]|uniref:hypothetical protein n=1 Tax=Algoriphagus marincola TaxID=264027 RepID=UPI00040903AD|nr:hypothetical protein [Algoriphagus marincola]